MNLQPCWLSQGTGFVINIMEYLRYFSLVLVRRTSSFKV